MKKNMLLLLFITIGFWSTAQYKPDGDKSSVKFQVKNFGVAVSGMFSGLKGNIVFDPANTDKTMFRVSISAATVDTDNGLRDKHLKGKDYFDAEHYQEISFEASKVSKTEKSGTYMVVGKLTIKNHSKEISFPFTAEPAGNGYLFKGVFSINRKDFEVGGASIISDTVQITLEVNAVK